MPRRILLLLIALALMDCRPAPARPLRIGIVLDHDGEWGAAYAAAEINAAGGIHGRKLELRPLRGNAVSSDAQGALVAADSLANDPSILGVVGHTNSSASLAAAQVYNEHHVVQIAPTTTTPLYDEAGKYSFRLVASDVHQSVFIANLVATGARARVATLYVNDDYGRALHTAFVDALARKGLTPVYDAPYGEGAAFTDPDELARVVARSRPETLVWLGRSRELAALLERLRPLIPSVRVVASDGSAGVTAETGQVPALVGVRYVRFVDLARPTAKVAAIRAGVQREWHHVVTDQGLLAYEAVQLLATAIRDAGPDREAIRDYLSDLGSKRPPFAGIAGPVTFDAHGDPPPVYYLAEVTRSGSRAVFAGPDNPGGR